MGVIRYDKTPGFPATIALESSQCFSFRRSLMYAAHFHRFAGAIVPQDIVFDPRYQVVNVYLPVDVNLSACTQVGFSAKRDAASRPSDPTTLDVFCVLTFLDTIPDSSPILINNIPRCGDLERAHLLFPGSWALLIWEKRVCLWYRTRQLLRANPRFPQGLLTVSHPNLTAVFASFLRTW